MKIKFWDLIRNSNGKLSGSGTAGFFICVSGILAFLAAGVGWFMGKELVLEYLDKIIFFTGTGAALLGVRKLKNEPRNEQNTP